jgi:hypothetical protein
MKECIRERPFNLKGGGGGGGGGGFFFKKIFYLWFFVSFRNCFSDNTRVRIFIFFVAQIFQNSTLGYMTKTLNQIIFFSSTKIRIFLSVTLSIRVTHYVPLPGFLHYSITSPIQRTPLSTTRSSFMGLSHGNRHQYPISLA